MNDIHLIISLKKKAKKRRSNFLFIGMLEAIEKEARLSTLSAPIAERLRAVCKLYNVNIDEDEDRRICAERPAHTTQMCIRRLRDVGFGVDR